MYNSLVINKSNSTVNCLFLGDVKIYGLCGHESCDILYMLANVLPMFVETYRCVLNFIFSIFFITIHY